MFLLVFFKSELWLPTENVPQSWEKSIYTDIYTSTCKNPQLKWVISFSFYPNLKESGWVKITSILNVQVVDCMTIFVFEQFGFHENNQLGSRPSVWSAMGRLFGILIWILLFVFIKGQIIFDDLDDKHRSVDLTLQLLRIELQQFSQGMERILMKKLDGIENSIEVKISSKIETQHRLLKAMWCR